ncbi:hypothetical protein SSX86_027431 [Deinandra increscens subsp. villosa]|uniref:At2g35280-like TPR domain-containing protein n=1 Tax=Deinandra increscens subsp. villosa TaxID=3103831 RepID=A0AAP0GP23_9ASTR
MGIQRKITDMEKNDSTKLSVRRHREKRVRKAATIGSLPRDLLVDVLGRVASSSFTDLFNVKLSCKDLLEPTEDDFIYQSVSIDKFSQPHWIPPCTKVRSFLTSCFNKGNPESLFRKGMVDYFNLVDIESGLKYLKIAAEKGHPEATYVYGMILLSGGDKSSQEGLNVLNSLRYSRSSYWNVQDSRDKVYSILSHMWIYNLITLEKVKTSCQKRDHVIRFERRGWSLDEDKEISSCDTCLWYRELVYFYKVMNVNV